MNALRILYNYKYYKGLEQKCSNLTSELDFLKKNIEEIAKKNKVIDLTNDSESDTLSSTFNQLTIKKPKKKNIPKTLKRVVWNKWIGEDLGTSKCLCCKVTSINQMSFHCGHIVSEFHGGELNLENLKPICGSCNLSMRTENMNDFIKRMKF